MTGEQKHRRSPGGERVDPATHREMPVESVGQVPGDHDLGGLAEAGVGAPDVSEVAQLGRQDPPEGGDLHFVELQVLPLLQVARTSEPVRVGRVEARLVQVADVAEDPDVQLAELGLRDSEAGAGRVLTEDLFLRLLRRCWRRRRLRFLGDAGERSGAETRENERDEDESSKSYFRPS